MVSGHDHHGVVIGYTRLRRLALGVMTRCTDPLLLDIHPSRTQQTLFNILTSDATV